MYQRQDGRISASYEVRTQLQLCRKGGRRIINFEGLAIHLCIVTKFKIHYIYKRDHKARNLRLIYIYIIIPVNTYVYRTMYICVDITYCRIVVVLIVDAYVWMFFFFGEGNRKN